MENRIRLINGHVASLHPAEAELWFIPVTEHTTPTTEIRGRLVGPRCMYTTTVEVAYPLRPLPRLPEGASPLTRRVVIPEPSFWDPQTPFLYRAFIELWQDGQPCDRAGFDRGLRTLDRGAQALYWNGRQLTLHGTTRLPKSPPEALELHQAGYNLLVGSVAEPRIWFDAYSVGLLMLGRLSLKESDLRRAGVLGGLVSCFGWLLGQEWLDQAPPEAIRVLNRLPQQAVIGVELSRVPATPLPEWVAFLVCPESLLPGLQRIRLPKLVWGRPKTNAGTPGILGWIDTP